MIFFPRPQMNALQHGALEGSQDPTRQTNKNLGGLRPSFTFKKIRDLKRKNLFSHFRLQ
jgi:hypothetical protein